MRVKERFDLIFKVAQKINTDFDIDDAIAYFNQFGIKNIYREEYIEVFDLAKGVLANQTENKVFEIAADMDINFEGRKTISRSSSYWSPSHFKLFLSHKSSIKEKVANLSTNLLDFGITSFVAHEDISPTAEWQNEIESALHSMDVLVAIITEDYSDSDWTDQEIGFALGRNIPIIPVAIDKMPYGFLGKIQAIKGKGKMGPEVAKEISEALILNPPTYQSYTIALADLFITSSHKDEALKWLNLIHKITPIPTIALEKIKNLSSSSYLVSSEKDILVLLNSLLVSAKLEPLTLHIDKQFDDIPF